MKNNRSRTTRAVFEEWGQDARADEMAGHHWQTVQQAFELIPKQPGHYLEIGIGNGYGIEHMATHQFATGNCLGLDLADSMVALSRIKNRQRTNVTIQQGDFLAWDFSAEEPFSLIFSMEVFYYFPDIQEGIAKAYSILRPGGQLWVLVNYYLENPTSHDWPEQLDTEMCLWSKQDYYEGFQKVGFSDVTTRLFHDETTDSDSDGVTLATTGTKPNSTSA